MSNASQRTVMLSLRLPKALLDKITVELEIRATRSLEAEWTRTEFVCHAIREFIRKKRASRKARPGRVRSPKRPGRVVVIQSPE